MGTPRAHRRSKLTPRERLFAHEYLRHNHNGKQAAIAAGYSPKGAKQTASRLLTRADLAALVAALEAKALAKVDSKRDQVLAELHHVGFARLSRCLDVQPDGEVKILPVEKWTEAERAAVSKVKVQAIFEGTGDERTHVGNLVTVEATGKMAALNTLAEHHKIVGDADGDLSFRLEDLLMLARKRRELKARESGGTP